MGVANSVHLVSDVADESVAENPVGEARIDKRAETSVVQMAPLSMSGFPAPTELPSAKWHIIHAKSVVDSHSQDELINEVRSLIASGAKRIAIDLRQNRFLSLPAIKACVEAATRLASKEKNFALISCPERTKRHFEIYGSLKHIHVTRTESDLHL